MASKLQPRALLEQRWRSRNSMANGSLDGISTAVFAAAPVGTPVSSAWRGRQSRKRGFGVHRPAERRVAAWILAACPRGVEGNKFAPGGVTAGEGDSARAMWCRFVTRTVRRLSGCAIVLRRRRDSS